MPAQTTTVSPSPAGDDLDDLFNYDVETDDVFRDYNPAMDAPVRSTSPARPKTTDLGIDEEIQITKKRKPIAKLDENRQVIPRNRSAVLLSQAGIPKLRRITKERLKFKGKGHEYSDVARLLNLYQLWLDDLYPRAKFADGLAMIEKLGHTKRLQTMRREWIKKGKPLERREDEPSGREVLSQSTARSEQSSANVDTTSTTSPANPPPPTKLSTSTSKPSHSESLFVSDDEPDLHPSDDELEALLAEDALRAVPKPHKADQHQPDDDELDALLAEDSAHFLSNQPPVPNSHSADPHPPSDDELGTFLAEETFNRPLPALAIKHDEFEDEMEAMAGMDDMW